MEHESAASDSNRTRKVTVRFSPEEFEKIDERSRQTNCKKLSLYIRKVLFGERVSIGYRNKSLDDFMEEVVLLRRELSAIGNNLNQVTRKINSCQSASELERWLPAKNEILRGLLEKIKETGEQLDKFSDLWLQYSMTEKI